MAFSRSAFSLRYSASLLTLARCSSCTASPLLMRSLICSISRSFFFTFNSSFSLPDAPAASDAGAPPAKTLRSRSSWRRSSASSINPFFTPTGAARGAAAGRAGAAGTVGTIRPPAPFFLPLLSTVPQPSSAGAWGRGGGGATSSSSSSSSSGSSGTGASGSAGSSASGTLPQALCLALGAAAFAGADSSCTGAAETSGSLTTTGSSRPIFFNKASSSWTMSFLPSSFFICAGSSFWPDAFWLSNFSTSLSFFFNFSSVFSSSVRVEVG
mmetsp:Transcript_14891/g.37726  ORF Transcript_14891/g.37726 Transcript_14891/m.37726 type:complete len:269 (-) Transcript_14891:317-1123(-)